VNLKFNPKTDPKDLLSPEVLGSKYAKEIEEVALIMKDMLPIAYDTLKIKIEEWDQSHLDTSTCQNNNDYHSSHKIMSKIY